MCKPRSSAATARAPLDRPRSRTATASAAGATAALTASRAATATPTTVKSGASAEPQGIVANIAAMFETALAGGFNALFPHI